MGRKKNSGAARGERMRRILLAIPITCTAQTAARADQWLLSGQASENLVFDSNIRLSTTDRQSAFGSITSVSGQLSIDTPRAGAQISGQAAVARYTQDSRLNSEDFGLNLQSYYRFPRSLIGLGASIRFAPTLLTEETDAGNFAETGNQLSFSIQPSWQYSLSQRDSIGVTGSWALRTFDSGSFVDSTSYAIQASWQHRVSPTESLSMGVSASYIISEGTLAPTEVQSYSAFIGWSKSLSERLTVTASAGPRLTFVSESGGAGDQGPSFGANFDLNLIYRTSQRGQLTLSAGQSVEPSSRGVIQERQRVGLRYGHRLSQRTQLSLAGTFQRNGRIFGASTGTGQDERIFIAAVASISYQLSRSWAASSLYSFRSQQSDGPFAVSHRIGIMLTYSPRGWSLGR